MGVAGICSIHVQDTQRHARKRREIADLCGGHVQGDQGQAVQWCEVGNPGRTGVEQFQLPAGSQRREICHLQIVDAQPAQFGHFGDRLEIANRGALQVQNADGKLAERLNRSLTSHGAWPRCPRVPSSSNFTRHASREVWPQAASASRACMEQGDLGFPLLIIGIKLRPKFLRALLIAAGVADAADLFQRLQSVDVARSARQINFLQVGAGGDDAHIGDRGTVLQVQFPYEHASQSGDIRPTPGNSRQ